MFVNDLFEGNDKDPCWKGYKQYGMKKKNGKEVPNCVPESQTTNEVEQRFSEPLTGWHIVYRSSGNPVRGTPSFESKDAAQKYLMTKMFANHHEFKVVHTAQVGVTESDPSGLLAASELNKSFIITAELAEGGKKKFRVKAQSERVAREKFSKHYAMAKILSVKEEGVSEAGLKFHGGFPDVDHMPGPVIRDADFATDNVRVKDKAEWERAVNSINARVFDDESEFVSSSKGKKVVGNGAVWAIWNDEKQVGWFNAKGRPLKTQSVGEAKKSSRDEKDVAAIRAVIQRLESELATNPNDLELKNRIDTEKKRLGLYGLEESSADSKIASLEKKKQALQNQLELARERRKMRGQRVQSPAETKLSSKISDLGQQIHMLKQGVSEGAPELLKAEMPLVRHIERELAGHGYEKGTDEYNTMFKHAIAYYRQFGNVDVIKKQGVAEGEKRKVQDRKTGEWYDPQEEIEKMYSDPEYVAMVQRMKREEGRGWPKRKEQGIAEDSPDDTNDYYADLYTDLLSQVRNMSLTDRANTKTKVKQDLDSGRVKLPDLKMEIQELDREIKDKKGVAEDSDKNVVKSVKVGNFRHDLVNTGFGWQVRIYNGDELYDTGLSKNTEEKGLAALDDAVAYTKKQLNIKEGSNTAEDNSLTTYVIIYKDEQNQTKKKKVQSTSASRAQAKFEKSYPNYRVVGLKDWEQGVAETNDYFTRRQREEDVIAGKKPARKKAPAQTSDYAKRREQQKKQELGENPEEMVRFVLDTERAYEAVMNRFGNVIEWDKNDYMMVPARLWPKVEVVAHAADGIGAEIVESNMAEDQSINPKDKITVDVPLLLRLMEYAREDAKTDMDLHNVTDRLIELSATGQTLTMQDYSAIVKQNELGEGMLYPGEAHVYEVTFDDGTKVTIEDPYDAGVSDTVKKDYPGKKVVNIDYKGISGMGLSKGASSWPSKADRDYHQQQQRIGHSQEFARAERLQQLIGK